MLSTMPKAMNGRVPGPGKRSQFWPLALLPSLWEIPSLALPSQTAHSAFLFLPDPKLQLQALILPMVFGLMEGDTSLFCRRRDTRKQRACHAFLSHLEVTLSLQPRMTSSLSPGWGEGASGELSLDTPVPDTGAGLAWQVTGVLITGSGGVERSP